MRGLGAFQKAQMKRSDPRVIEFFCHIRAAIDILEHLALEAREETSPTASLPIKSEKGEAPAVSKEVDSGKIAYGIKEASKMTGLGRTSLYQAISNKHLRAVKYGKRTFILAKDLHAWMDALPTR